MTGSHTIAPDSQISLTLAADGTLSARAGCNSMSGKYVVTNDVLLSPLQASTMMACDQALMDQDTWFSAFLSSKPTLKYADGILTLSNGTDTIVFAAAPSGAAAVEGTGWKLTDLISVSGSTVAAVDPTLTAWIRFNAGEVVFNNSCNTGGGSAEIGDTDITFGPLRSTLIFCDGASGALETVMNAVLQGVTPYTVTTDPSGTRLRIMSTDGVTGLGFVADPTVGVDAFPSASAVGHDHVLGLIARRHRFADSGPSLCTTRVRFRLSIADQSPMTAAISAVRTAISAAAVARSSGRSAPSGTGVVSCR